ncbi:alpha/beta fold hydrolase [Nocardiopsis metallicus]|uniref:Pimeloyl-ACP methyl ester carboxylesterase n=1 Tax=Nocardiopsis metallicus TaxID=179819 RepID=A0A840WM77_9ACTN|nr:alpha/beta hydrolase [Nocardiopsis metallicus]MBB5491208.1 pimeloyl-ACP methyl ester carboxylesterase [Nocardiopsis metallicus]
MTASLPAHETGSVTSRDGTLIGYRRLGGGPAIVLWHGSMMSSHNLLRLGSALSDRFTVYLPDLRGRGLSGPHGPGFCLERAAGDVAALVEHTGARGVFGLSAGAVPVLRWGLTAPRKQRIALYEPPLAVGAFSPTAWLPRYEREMAQGRPAAAMATVVRGTQDPPWLRFVPRTVLVPLLRLGLRAQAEQVRQAGAGVPLRDLLPTMGADARMVRESAGLAEAAATARARLLLLGGSRSARYLREALDALEDGLPGAGRVEFAGLGHLAADNDGQPERVADALAGFFAPLLSRSARS